MKSPSIKEIKTKMSEYSTLQEVAAVWDLRSLLVYTSQWNLCFCLFCFYKRKLAWRLLGNEGGEEPKFTKERKPGIEV